MPKLVTNTSDTKDSEFKIGDLVVLKNYQGKIKGGKKSGTREEKLTIELSGNLNHVSPIMIITGVHFENEKKALFSEETGERIADRIKYDVVWFDTKKSQFAFKTVYESYLDEESSKLLKASSDFNYTFGAKAKFRTTPLEMIKVKGVEAYDQPEDLSREKGVNTSNRKVMTFTCPEIIITGVKNNEKPLIKDQSTGEIRSIRSKKLIKVMWFNFSQQKFSEEYVPQECLTTK